MKIGTAIQQVAHPAQLDWAEGSNLLRQTAEYLTETGPDNVTRPRLLDRWEADTDVKIWTLHLRRNVQFNNGRPFTADDVIFNFEQWLDPAINSSVKSLLAYLSPNDIEKVDDYTVRLYLQEPQVGLPEHLYHYPALIMPHTFEGDFIAQPIGTGPFVMTEYILGERAVFKRRPDYWQAGADGKTLPYLDELIYLDLEPDERTAAMQGGVIDTLYLPRITDWAELKNAPGISVFRVSTSQTAVLRMRVDRPPWNDVRVRNALKLCQDREKLLQLSFFGQGDLGFDAHVAPVHPAYCDKEPPAYNPAQARELLAEAGFPNGLSATLTTKIDQGEDKMAQLLKELAAPGGFNLTLNIVDPARYWESWIDVDLGITHWAHRPLSTMLLALGYTGNADGQPVAWNETRWMDEEFTQLLRQAERTLDITERRNTLCKIEDIMQERGPIGISYWRNSWMIVNSKFKGVKPHPAGFDLFTEVWKNA